MQAGCAPELLFIYNVDVLMSILRQLTPYSNQYLTLQRESNPLSMATARQGTTGDPCPRPQSWNWILSSNRPDTTRVFERAGSTPVRDDQLRMGP